MPLVGARELAPVTPPTTEVLEDSSADDDDSPLSPRSFRVFNHTLSRTSSIAADESSETPTDDLDSLRRRLRRQTISSSFTGLASQPLWSPPAVRRTKSFEIPRCSSFNISVTVEKNAQGRRELQMCVQCFGRVARVSIQLRSLVFWFAFYLLFVPTGAFQLMPGMAGPGVASKSAARGAMQGDRHHLGAHGTPRIIVPLDAPADSACREAAGGAVALSIERLQTAEPATLAGLLESCEASVDADGHYSFDEEEFEECIVDAESHGGDISACLTDQVKSSSLEELSTAIAKEGTTLLQGMADDGTVSCLVYNLLSTAKKVHGRANDVGKGTTERRTKLAELAMMTESDATDAGTHNLDNGAAEAMTEEEDIPQMIRQSAIRACVSIGMHKAMLAAMPIVTAATQVAAHLH